MAELLIKNSSAGFIKSIIFDKDGTLSNSEEYLIDLAKTRIEYSIHPDGNMTITTNEPAVSANDTATSGIGDLDNTTSVYDYIYKNHSHVETTVSPTYLYIYAPGSAAGMTNFGSGSTLHHYQWEKS